MNHKEMKQKIATRLQDLREAKTDRTIKIIQNGGRIVIKSGQYYMHSHTNIAGGPDRAVWNSSSKCALEMFSLTWAFTIAKLYANKFRTCKVVVIYPKK